MPPLIDLTGARFGRWTVICRAGKAKNGHTQWLCECACGQTEIVGGDSLKSGHSRSCGCLRKETHWETHGKSKTKLFRVWCAMRDRCLRPTDKCYSWYGGRGISVCSEWSNSFQEFYNWALNSGYSAGLTIDRIDNNGNYTPSNCRWVDRSTQSRNRRSTHFITVKGETHCIKEWSEITGISENVIYLRINRLKWSPERAVSEPVKSIKKSAVSI